MMSVPQWKSCKLGRGLQSDRLEIGGGNILVPARGAYTLTFFTPSFGQARLPLPDPTASPSLFRMQGYELWPAATLTGSSFVPEASPVLLHLRFSAPVDANVLRANFSAITLDNGAASVEDLIVYSDTWFGIVVTPAAAADSAQGPIVQVRVPQGLVFALNDTDPDGWLPVKAGRANTAAAWSFIYSPPESRVGSPVWHPLVYLRDRSDRWPDGPDGGWWVTAIHANLAADTGHVLLTGWGRSQEFACTSAGARKFGVSFMLDPAQLDALSSASAAAQAGTALELRIDPISESPRNRSDVLYCSGHAPLRDGRKLYAGGATYRNLSTALEIESGLEYARMYDPKTGNFSMYDDSMRSETHSGTTFKLPAPDRRSFVALCARNRDEGSGDSRRCQFSRVHVPGCVSVLDVFLCF